MIKNGISDADTQRTDFTLINTCGSGSDFGLSSDISVNNTLIPPDPVFSVVGAGSGTIDVIAEIPGQPGVVFAGTLADCGGIVVPELGACCIDLGSSSFCIDGITEFECGTGEFYPGMTCDEACPAPMLEVGATAPASVGGGEPITYAITIENPGPIAVENVPAFAAAPVGTTITSVSVANLVNQNASRVDWLIPSIPVGGQETLLMIVEPPCEATTVTLASTSYGASLGLTPFRGPDLTTQVTSAYENVGFTVSSVAPGGEPMIQGDLVTHTITLTNSSGTDAEGLSLDCFTLGNGCSLVAVLDDAGGTVTTDLCGESVSWTGDLPANSTRTLVLSARLDCVSQGFPGGAFAVLLNRGVRLNLRGAMPCDSVIESVSAMPIEAVPPLQASLSYREITAGTFRLNPVTAGFFPPVVGLGRLGEEIEVVLTVENTAGPDLADASVSYSLNTMFEAPSDTPGDPFIGTPPAGTTFDPVSETVTYAGPLATGETIEIPMRLVLAFSDRPDDGVMLSSTAGCAIPVAPSRDAEVYAVPETPSETHVHGISGFDHYRHDSPLGDGFDARLPDFYFEILVGIKAGADNSLYVADVLRSYVLNPDTLFFNGFEGFARPADADPVSGGVLHIDGTDLWRYLPDGSRELVYRDPAGAFSFSEAVVTDDGRIHAFVTESSTGNRSLATLDPNGATLPLDASAWSGFIQMPEISYAYESQFGPDVSRAVDGIGDDGDGVFAIVRTTWSGPTFQDGAIAVAALVRVDASGAATVVEPELAVTRSLSGPPVPAEASPIFLSSISGIAAVRSTGEPILEVNFGQAFAGVDLQNRLPVGFILPASPYAGIALVEPGCGRADLNGDGVLDLLDVSAFTDLFNARDARADFVADGLFDLADIGAFIDAFLAGCGF